MKAYQAHAIRYSYDALQLYLLQYKYIAQHLQLALL